MLTVNFMYCGDKLLPNNAMMFNATMMNRNDLLTHPFSRKIIKEIDKSDVINVREISSPTLGIITRSELSGGTKGLLLMAFETKLRTHYFRGGGFGDNCAKYILEIAQSADIKLALSHLMNFPEDGLKIFIENCGKTVTNWDEYALQWAEYCADR